MTIDLGFACTTLPSGREIGFVDVPGHSRFIRNMLAGASAVDACLFVVAATEGWMAQSEEHLRITELLGLKRGVVALTKVGLLDEECRQLASLDVAEHLVGSPLADAEIVSVDAPIGLGMQNLQAALDSLLATTENAIDKGRPRLWVDRSFAVPGAGTIVTGTLSGGCLAVGDELLLEPESRPTRVRGLQSHYRSLRVATPGRRLAVNLTGVPHGDIARGHVLVKPGQWHLTSCCDASLRVLSSARRPLSHRGAFAVYIGAAELGAQLRLLGATTAVRPGEEGLVRMWLRGGVPLPLLPGDRYVLRDLGQGATLGGGELLDVAPVLKLSRAAPDLTVERVVAERGRVDSNELERLTGVGQPATAGHWVISPPVLTTAMERLWTACRAAGRSGLELTVLGEVERALISGHVPGLVTFGNRVFDSTLVPCALSDNAVAVLRALEANPWAPPMMTLTERGALRELERHSLVHQVGELWFATSAVEGAIEVLAKLGESPSGFSVSEVRQALGTTRKYALPILTHLDATGVTRRRGERRFVGPVLARRQRERS